MLLVIDNIVNLSPDTIVMVTGAKFNSFDLADEIKSGRGAFDGLNVGPSGAGPDGYPYAQAGRFYVTPLMTSDALQKSSAYARAQALFGQIDVVCAASWPDDDPTMSWPAMKAGLGAATPAWFGRPPMQMGAAMDGYATNVLVWIIPPGDGAITLTRIEPMTYQSVAPSGPIPGPLGPVIPPILPIGPGHPPQPLGPVVTLKLSDKVSVIGPNLPAAADNNPTFSTAVTFSTWIIPKTVGANDLATDPLWREFLSSVSYRKVPTPAVLAPPATQAILLPDNAQSSGRDYLDGRPGAIPSSPCVHFDLLIGAQVAPICRGTVDYSRAELVYDEIQRQRAVEDAQLKLMKAFGWAFQALLGVADWGDPALGIAINMAIDIENPPD